MQETSFKSGMDIYEYLPWLGIMGFAVTFAESLLLGEYDAIIHTHMNWNIFMLFGLFTISMITFNSISPFYIKRSSASIYNIALVSQIFWSYLVEIIFNRASPKGYEYYLGFVIILFGIIVFSRFSVIDIEKETINVEERKVSLLEGNNSETSIASIVADKFTFYKNNSLNVRASKYMNDNLYI